MEGDYTTPELNQYDQNVMSLGEWVLTVFISFLPLIGLVMLIVWSLSDNINPNKRNWARATLIIYLIFMVLYFLLMIFVFGSLMSGVEEMYRM
ncbi:hypothetical protein ACKGJO_05370 [Gracilimonas sp. Q87]|uniref:hypothetical protein n=1 Tax=Gracilimonas sp. Q87 TaxID=3384766 RepID=UPI00398454E2